MLHFPESNKPDPIVPKTLIAEVSERVDCKGDVVVELNEEEAERSIRRLVAKGVEAIAICFLWSFKHPEHERRVKAMVEELAPRSFRLLLGRSRSPLGRVRTHGGDRDQRLPRAGHGLVHGQRGASGRVGPGWPPRCRSCSAGEAWSRPARRRESRS